MKRTRTTRTTKTTTTSMGAPVSIKMANYSANKRQSSDTKRGRERERKSDREEEGGESWTTKPSNSVSVSPPAPKEIS